MRKRYVGEAIFLRALYYFYLTTEWGEVPLFTEPFTEPDDALIAKSPIADIQAVMIRDLNDAINDLPVSYDAKDLGRATSGAAKSLLGKVYLFMKDYVNAEKYLGEVIATLSTAILRTTRSRFSKFSLHLLLQAPRPM